MQLLRRSNKALSPAIPGGDGIARLESLRSRLDHLADGATLQRLAQFERRHIRFPSVHSAAHVWVHRHVEISDEHLLVLKRLQFGPRQGKVGCGRNPVGAGGEPNLTTWGFGHRGNVDWTHTGFKLALPINRNDRLAGEERNTGGNGGGSSRFHG